MAVVYLGLGSNLGERAQHLVQACAVLHQHPAITVLAVSSLYQTAPVGFTDQAWFLNAVARVQTSPTPAALLSVTQATERRLGRTPAPRWGPRVIDIDILLYDAVQLHRPFLTIPHAAMHDRAFVLVPLHELAPDLQLPSGEWVRDRIVSLPNDGSVQRYGPFPPFGAGDTEESAGTH
jgi:2-amino-4-hydroxy-6-hydroxymethyldihydropteridine diphosphokinase